VSVAVDVLVPVVVGGGSSTEELASSDRVTVKDVETEGRVVPVPEITGD